MFDLGVQRCSEQAQGLAQFIGIFRGREPGIEFVDAFVQGHVSLRVSFLSGTLDRVNAVEDRWTPQALKRLFSRVPVRRPRSYRCSHDSR